MDEAVIGIDLGTQGVRILAVNPAGKVISAAHQALPASPSNLPAGWNEQSPLDWWKAVKTCLLQLTGLLPPGTHLAGISIDSTSGTILPVDESGEPLYPAIMYNDRRAEAQVPAVQAAAASFQQKLGLVFGSSFALPKLLWFRQNQPGLFGRTARFIHAADFIAGRLSGDYGYSDTSNALKTGYDPLERAWPAFIEQELGISLRCLPQVVLPGEKTGQVSPHAAAETGLVAGIPLFAGATDGTAAQFASGAARPGDWNSTLGTTLVLKGISRCLVVDPLGRIYSHLHPEGWWMPGGASNTGAEWITIDHPGADPAELDLQAAACLPTRLVRYPLAKRGERFPFIHPGAAGFSLGEPASLSERFAAGLEGLALVERLAYEMLQGLGLELGERIYLSGGASRSHLWSQVRASLLNRTLLRPAVTETAMGAAMLAASGCWYGTVSQAAQNMVTVAEVIQPVPAWQGAYNEKFALFVAEMKSRGYI